MIIILNDHDHHHDNHDHNPGDHSYCHENHDENHDDHNHNHDSPGMSPARSPGTGYRPSPTTASSMWQVSVKMFSEKRKYEKI